MAKDIIYQLYHKHDDYTNPVITDSVSTLEDYAKQAKEYGHGIISSCAHGTQGNYWLCSELAEKYGLKWRYVTEAYFVKDRQGLVDGKRDNTNCHMILAAKTRKGIGDLNYALSEANISGFYYHPRIDLDILSTLDPKDVFVTTACVGGIFKYGFKEAELLIQWLNSHFKGSFMLEVQAHEMEKQITVNEFLLSMYRKYGIPLIAATDSHYVKREDERLRQQRLEANHIVYEDESGVILDYPSGEELYQRFKQQGILSDVQIREAMDNTNVFLDFEDIVLDKSKKIPNIYPSLTQEQRNEKYKELVYQKWDEYKQSVSPADYPRYEEGIAYEVNTITETNTSDYFLFDYEMVKEGKKLGGVLTKTGRGSGPSYFTNTLLGFSSIDRFALPVTMYPDRFISKDRLLAGSLPDLDLNVADPEPFEQAQTKVLGEWHSAKMVAFGKLSRLSAWKMYCRAENIPYELANDLSKHLKNYELDYKHADEDEKDELNPYDYIPAEYHEQLRMSEKYLGLIDNISPHPCAYLLCTEDIRREIGIYRINSKTGKKKTIYAAYIDGATAERFGYLKNDLLTVAVVDINAKAYKRAGVPQPSVPELIKMTENDDETWSMYAKGYTMGLNQVEQEKSSEKVMRYKPRNISELSAFVAGIRPAFQSMVNKLLDREHFDYAISTLDNLLQTKEMPSSFILYQEQMMTVLQYGGFSAPESYASIKAIAKKHPEKVLPLKQRFLDGFKQKLVEDGTDESTATETAEQVWVIISDACGYGFNSSHSVSVGLDSLYGAYLKAHYPMAYYTTLLSHYSQKGDKERIMKIRIEMKKAFGISMVPCRYRQDNRDYFIDTENNTISDALTSCKYISAKVASRLCDMSDNVYFSFIDVLYDMTMDPAFNTRQIKALIKMGYFDEFGHNGKLLKLFYEFTEGKNKFAKTLVPASQEKRINALYDIEDSLEDTALPMAEQLSFEYNHYGAPMTIDPSTKGIYVAIDVDDKYSPKITLYSVATGRTGVMRTKKKLYLENQIQKGDIIKLNKWTKKPQYKFSDGKPEAIPGTSDIWMDGYSIIYRDTEENS